MTIIDLLLMIVLGIGWIWGIKCLFAEHMILGTVAVKLRELIPTYITKPLFDCPPCMSSIHGSFIYLVYSGRSIQEWILYCILLCGFNYIIKLWLYE
jgi:hypothetical protein